MSRAAPALACLLLGAAARAQGPVLAVLDVRDPSGVLADEQARGELRRYLASKLAEGGRYQVVPEAQLHEALSTLKKESYQECVEESCQIELGREVAAQKVLLTEVVQLGQSCAVTATLYDLTTAASERAATHRGGCQSDDLVRALETVAAKLREGGEATADPKATGPAAKVPPPPPPEPRLVFETREPALALAVEITSASGEKVRCPAAVSRGQPCALMALPAGALRYRVSTPEGDLEQALQGSGVRYAVVQRPSPASFWLTVGAGLSMAAGTALVGGGIWSEEKGLIYGGLPTLGAGIAAFIVAQSLGGRLEVEPR